MCLDGHCRSCTSGISLWPLLINIFISELVGNSWHIKTIWRVWYKMASLTQPFSSSSLKYPWKTSKLSKYQKLEVIIHVLWESKRHLHYQYDLRSFYIHLSQSIVAWIYIHFIQLLVIGCIPCVQHCSRNLECVSEKTWTPVLMDQRERPRVVIINK